MEVGDLKYLQQATGFVKVVITEILVDKYSDFMVRTVVGGLNLACDKVQLFDSIIRGIDE